MSNDKLHDFEPILKAQNVEFHLQRFLSALDQIGFALCQAQNVYRSLKEACQKARNKE